MFDAPDADNFVVVVVVVVAVVIVWHALPILSSAYGLDVLDEIALAVVRVHFGGVSGLILLLGHVIEVEMEKYFCFPIESNSTSSTSR